MPTNISANPTVHMKIMDKVRIIDTQVYNNDQSWYYKRIIELSRVRKVHKLSFDIRRNAYDFQSYAHVNRWDGTKWHRVYDMPISACVCGERVSYVTRGVKANDFEVDYQRMLTVVKDILTI